MLSNAMLGANSKITLLNSNLVIFKLVSIFGRFASTVGQHAPEGENIRLLLFPEDCARGVTVSSC